MRRLHVMLPLLLAGLFPFVHAQSCSEERVLSALKTLEECGIAGPLELTLPEDRSSCIEQLLRVAVPKDTSAVETACQPGTTGQCLDVLLERGRPANDEGWREMGRACAFVSGSCARLFATRFRLDVNDLSPFHRFCSALAGAPEADRP